MAKTKKRVYQFKITLKDVKPAIWRRVQVESHLTLRQFSRVIQAAMGWVGGHLHMFNIGGEQYSVPSEDWEDVKDDSALTLGKVPAAALNKIIYEYDMGDGWRHLLELEGIGPAETGKTYPACLAGARACPPEDCGGPYGYQDFLVAIKDKKHPEHKEKLDWIGGRFDPEFFSLEETNAALSDIDYDDEEEELL